MEKLVTQMIRDAEALNRAGRASEAIFALERIAVEALNVLGLTYFDALGSGRLAEKYLRMSLAVDPGNWMVHNNLGHIYDKTARFQEAKKAALDAVAWANNTSPAAYHNAGVILGDLKETREAIKMYRAALALAPENPMYHFNLGAELLRIGEYEEGWEKYEYRMANFPDIQQNHDRFKAPKWDGSRVKTLAVYSEQGIGDLINFGRYLPDCRARCDRLTLEVQEGLEELYAGMADEILVKKLGEASELPQVDAAIAVASLPSLFKAGILTGPSELLPYNPKSCPDELKVEGIKIGIVWAGNPIHRHDKLRSCSLSRFAPLAEIPGVKLFSLQKNSSETASFPLVDLSPKLTNFARTADFVAYLDAVVAVDTSVAHLAGALEKPVYLLNAYVGDWRWGMEGEKTFWYPSMTIIRQPSYGDWDSVFNQLTLRVSSDLNLRQEPPSSQVSKAGSSKPKQGRKRSPSRRKSSRR